MPWLSPTAPSTLDVIEIIPMQLLRSNTCNCNGIEFCKLLQWVCSHELPLSSFCLGLSVFLLGHIVSRAPLRYEPRVCVSFSRSISEHPKIPNASSGFVLGCWASTGAVGRLRPSFSPVKFGFFGGVRDAYSMALLWSRLANRDRNVVATRRDLDGR
jgi:hypothetical protein